MRLLFVTPFYYPEHKFGGPPRKIHSLGRGLFKRGYQVRVLTFHSERPEGMDKVEVDGISVTYLPWFGRGLKQWPRKTFRMLQAVEWAELVHCYGLYNFLCPMAGRSAKRSSRPVVLEPLGMYPARTGNAVAKHLYNAILTRWMVKAADALVAASAAEVRDLRMLAPKKDIVHRRNGVDVERFALLPSGDHLRGQWAIAPEEKVILYLGRLSPIKNLEQLIHAFGKADIPNARLVLVGPGEGAYEEHLRTVITRDRLESRVTFAGPLYDDDQKAALGLASLFVLPSLNESFGNAAAEAVAAGVPVLLTDTCGIAPLIHGRAGIAVPLGVESIANGMRMMLDPEIRAQMTARSEEVKRELSWEEPIRQTIELYEKIVAESRK